MVCRPAAVEGLHGNPTRISAALISVSVSATALVRAANIRINAGNSPHNIQAPNLCTEVTAVTSRGIECADAYWK
jgi:hypothetical protein